MMMRLFVALTFVGFVGFALAEPSSQTQAPLVFRVTGEVQAFPETAVLKFMVVGEGETLGKAQEQLQQSEQAVFKVLEKFGVRKDQVLIERFAIIPLQPSLSSGPPSPVALRPLGYRVQKGYGIVLPVSVETLDKLLQLADAVLQQGARPTVVTEERYGYYPERMPYTLVEFMVRDPERLTQQAMDDALNRARKLAEQATRHIGKVNLKLVRLTVSNIQTFPERRTITPEGRDPIGTFVWQPIRVTVQAEVLFTYE
ncbi:MAG: SIMPL domain-containing protein [Armatimonadetes bacterium]|nr:SIMPL domain-containing protein [Armatimonadota bacterium]MCX7968147.1 SIMPL domain-containing protein [Armatimonadota bacterium]MDW8143985.1 SIMPL domain-containing protein [Armatimonadota bacterium]